MKKIMIVAALAALTLSSCNKAENRAMIEDAVAPHYATLTKGMYEKTPQTLVYVETNDVNPLNAGDYFLPDSTTFFDYVCFFAANIHSTTVGSSVQPTLYFNPELTPYVCNNGSPNTAYIDALHEKNQGVLLGILGDWVGLGLANMNTTQQTQFATILAYVITQCGFDGVVFDDEYSGSNTVVSDSYSNIILQLRALLPDVKIFVFDWGATDSISSTAAAEIDFADHGYFGYYLPYTYSDITGMTVDRWSPISLKLELSYSNSALSTIQTWAANAANAGYGEIQTFNLRSRCDVDPLPVLTAIARGAGWIVAPDEVTCTNGCRAQAAAVPGGCTVTYAMATAN